MQEKKKQYILDDLLRIILAMFVLTVLFAFSCLLLSHGARGIWLAVLAQFTLLGVLGGVFLRRCLRIVQKNEQVMQLYAAGYTIADICHLKCYFSRGTEMALKKAVALLDTGKLLSVSKRQAQYLALFASQGITVIEQAGPLDTQYMSMLEQENHHQKQYVSEAKSRYEKTQSFRHDIKNHLSVIHGLLEKGEIKKAEEYLENMDP